MLAPISQAAAMIVGVTFTSVACYCGVIAANRFYFRMLLDLMNLDDDDLDAPSAQQPMTLLMVGVLSFGLLALAMFHLALPRHL